MPLWVREGYLQSKRTYDSLSRVSADSVCGGVVLLYLLAMIKHLKMLSSNS
jgi:hypothetical protein